MHVTAYDEHSEEIDRLTAAILTPELGAALKKKLGDELNPIWEAAVDAVLEGAADSVSAVAASRAAKFLEAVLAGDPDAAARLFGLTGFTGRRVPAEPPVIHGRVFESAPIELRRQLVEAHAELLRDARIADLENLPEGARAQIARLQRDQDRRRNEFA